MNESFKKWTNRINLNMDNKILELNDQIMAINNKVSSMMSKSDRVHNTSGAVAELADSIEIVKDNNREIIAMLTTLREEQQAAA